MKHVWSTRHAPEPPTDRFAHELGFASYLDLFEASTPVASSDEKAWCITHLRNGEWVVWNDRELTIEGRYKTQEEAASHVSGGQLVAHP